MSLFSTLHRLVLALVLCCASAAALAGPSYRVTIDTAGLSGSGYLDFSVVGTPGAPGALASVSNLTGAFGPEAERVGAVAGAIPSGFTLANGAGDNYLTQAVSLGGLFAFDISFGGDYQSVQGIDGATFAINLFDQLFSSYTLAASFAAQPADGVGAASLTPLAHLAGVTIAPVAEVPEPSELALLAAGLAALALARLRAARRRPSAFMHTA